MHLPAIWESFRKLQGLALKFLRVPKAVPEYFLSLEQGPMPEKIGSSSFILFLASP